MNLVTDGVHQVLNAYRPPSPSPSPEYHSSTSDAPSLIGTKEIAPSANSTVSDLNIQTLQKQMEMIQAMMTQMSQLSNDNSHSKS